MVNPLEHNLRKVSCLYEFPQLLTAFLGYNLRKVDSLYEFPQLLMIHY